jgi:hypothetical protein
MKKFKGLNVPHISNDTQDYLCGEAHCLTQEVDCRDCLFDKRNIEQFNEWLK